MQKFSQTGALEVHLLQFVYSFPSSDRKHNFDISSFKYHSDPL